LEHPGAAFGAYSQGFLRAEIRCLAIGAVALAEIEFDPQVPGQLQSRRERAPLLAAESVQRPDEALADEFVDFFGRPLAPQQDGPDVEVALLALELPVRFLNDATAPGAGRGHGRECLIGNVARLDPFHQVAR